MGNSSGQLTPPIVNGVMVTTAVDQVQAALVPHGFSVEASRRGQDTTLTARRGDLAVLHTMKYYTDGDARDATKWILMQAGPTVGRKFHA